MTEDSILSIILIEIKTKCPMTTVNLIFYFFFYTFIRRKAAMIRLTERREQQQTRTAVSTALNVFKCLCCDSKKHVTLKYFQSPCLSTSLCVRLFSSLFVG